VAPPATVAPGEADTPVPPPTGAPLEPGTVEQGAADTLVPPPMAVGRELDTEELGAVDTPVLLLTEQEDPLGELQGTEVLEAVDMLAPLPMALEPGGAMEAPLPVGQEALRAMAVPEAVDMLVPPLMGQGQGEVMEAPHRPVPLEQQLRQDKKLLLEDPLRTALYRGSHTRTQWRREKPSARGRFEGLKSC